MLVDKICPEKKWIDIIKTNSIKETGGIEENDDL